MITVRILLSLEAVDAHDGGGLGDEHLLNLRYFLQLCGYIFRVHVVVGGEGFEVLLVAFAAFEPLCVCRRARYRNSKVPRIM